jgi:hypothetical protein
MPPDESSEPPKHSTVAVDSFSGGGQTIRGPVESLPGVADSSRGAAHRFFGSAESFSGTGKPFRLAVTLPDLAFKRPIPAAQP